MNKWTAAAMAAVFVLGASKAAIGTSMIDFIFNGDTEQAYKIVKEDKSV